MEQHTETILSVSDIKVSFKNRTETKVAVSDITFELKKGETLAIVGESGSGKSVTSLSIMRLLPKGSAHIDAGTIVYNDEELSERVVLSELSEKGIIKYRGTKIAMIFQEPMSALNPSMKCGEQVAEMLRIHTDFSKDAIKDEVIDKFTIVDLPNPLRIYNSYPHELSGGQLQRVMIAMAIICKPDILIADEPTTALDVTIQKKIISLLKDLKEEYNLSTIFITHDLGLVKSIADRVIVMCNGNIIEQGNVVQIFDNPQESYTKGLIACRPPLDKRYTRLPMVSDFMDNASEDMITQLIQPLDDYKQRLQSLDKNDVLLEARNIKKFYPTKKNIFGKPTTFVKAVDDVSFQLRKGEILGLVGESGCGKSTLAKVLMRLIESTSGSVIYDRKELFSLSSSEMRKVRKDYQIIFQDPYGSLNPRMKIGSSILEPMQVHSIGRSKSERKEKAIELLEKVGLEADHFIRYPHQFSGGQRQRVCIARALSSQPKFILCDESVSALDVSVQAQVLNLLKDLRDELELSYIFISHDLSVVKFISDYIMVMQAGKIVERGDAESVIGNPKDPYTQLLVDSIPT